MLGLVWNPALDGGEALPAMSAFTIAVLIVLGLLVAYGWGYRSGVAYCARQLKPLEDAAKELRELTRRR